ncbi:unnamed protein product [Umbelopsis vinacea]|jgi:hypothetical protein
MILLEEKDIYIAASYQGAPKICFHRRAAGYECQDCPELASVKCFKCNGFGHIRRHCKKIAETPKVNDERRSKAKTDVEEASFEEEMDLYGNRIETMDDQVEVVELEEIRDTTEMDSPTTTSANTRLDTHPEVLSIDPSPVDSDNEDGIQIEDDTLLIPIVSELSVHREIPISPRILVTEYRVSIHGYYFHGGHTVMNFLLAGSFKVERAKATLLSDPPPSRPTTTHKL